MEKKKPHSHWQDKHRDRTLGLAKLVYSTSLLTISKPLIDSINKIIFSVIWEGKTPKIKIKNHYRRKETRGLQND